MNKREEFETWYRSEYPYKRYPELEAKHWEVVFYIDPYGNYLEDTTAKAYKAYQAGRAAQPVTVPSDKELIEFALSEEFLLFCDEDEFIDIAKTVLQKFGCAAPTAAADEGLIVLADSVPDTELPGMYSSSDFSGGETDTAPAVQPLSDEQLDDIFDSLGGVEGFCKSFGYRQFARAVLNAQQAIGAQEGDE